MNHVDPSRAVLLDFAPMDQTHTEFLRLLTEVQAASDNDLPQAWRLLLDHATRQFDQEDTWMRDTAYASGQTHRLQHRVVLHLMQEALDKLQSHEWAEVRTMAQELGNWFGKHTQTMDAALAMHLRQHDL